MLLYYHEPVGYCLLKIYTQSRWCSIADFYYLNIYLTCEQILYKYCNKRGSHCKWYIIATCVHVVLAKVMM